MVAKISSFLHRITGARRKSMEDFPGGLLADDMGLGKTLMMIVVIVSTLEFAEKHAKTMIPKKLSLAPGNLIPAKSTLILVPSARELYSILGEQTTG